MNVPNAITLARIALVPVFVVYGLRDSTSPRVVALIVFVVASFSDFVDGYLARRDEKVSRAGAFLDPTADKLLIGAALVVLVIERDFPLWAALLLGAREVVVQILRTNIVRHGGSLPASTTAKIKTFSQIVMVSWWLLPWDERNVMHAILLGETIIFSLLSATEYLMRRPRERVS